MNSLEISHWSLAQHVRRVNIATYMKLRIEGDAFRQFSQLPTLSEYP